MHPPSGVSPAMIILTDWVAPTGHPLAADHTPTCPPIVLTLTICPLAPALTSVSHPLSSAPTIVPTSTATSASILTSVPTPSTPIVLQLKHQYSLTKSFTHVPPAIPGPLLVVLILMVWVATTNQPPGPPFTVATASPICLHMNSLEVNQPRTPASMLLHSP
ncbi:hypothetical protein V8E53_005069 [Lactarius tabidus]